MEFEFTHPIHPVPDFTFLYAKTYTALTELEYSVTTNGTTKVFQGDVNFATRIVQGNNDR